VESEGRKANIQAEAKANQRWPSTPTTRQKNGEVSYGTFSPSDLRGSVQKADGGVGMVIMVGMDGKLMI
jgi:hypothetical protein